MTTQLTDLLVTRTTTLTFKGTSIFMNQFDMTGKSILESERGATSRANKRSGVEMDRIGVFSQITFVIIV